MSRREDHLDHIVDAGGIIGIGDRVSLNGGPQVARALTAATVTRFDRAELESAFMREPLLARFFESLQVEERARDQTIARNVAGRVARQLEVFAEGRACFTLPVTQEELGRLVGASRERVNKVLQQLMQAGVVEYTGRRYRILAEDALLRMSEGRGPWRISGRSGSG